MVSRKTRLKQQAATTLLDPEVFATQVVGALRTIAETTKLHSAVRVLLPPTRVTEFRRFLTATSSFAGQGLRELHASAAPMEADVTAPDAEPIDMATAFFHLNNLRPAMKQIAGLNVRGPWLSRLPEEQRVAVEALLPTVVGRLEQVRQLQEDLVPQRNLVFQYAN